MIMDAVIRYQKAKFRSFMAILNVLTYIKEEQQRDPRTLCYFFFSMDFPLVTLNDVTYVFSLNYVQYEGLFLDVFIGDLIFGNQVLGNLCTRFRVHCLSDLLISNLESIPTFMRTETKRYMLQAYQDSVMKFVSNNYESMIDVKLMLDCSLTFGRGIHERQVEEFVCRMECVLDTCSDIVDYEIQVIHRPKKKTARRGTMPICEQALESLAETASGLHSYPN